MSAFDLIELLTNGAMIALLIFCLPWGWLFGELARQYPRQLEPFEYFGSIPERWLVAEYFFPTTEPGYPLAGHHLHYSDEQYEFVSVARVIQVPVGAVPLADVFGHTCGYYFP